MKVSISKLNKLGKNKTNGKTKTKQKLFSYSTYALAWLTHIHPG